MRVDHSEYDQRGTIFSSGPGSNGAFQKTIFIHLQARNAMFIVFFNPNLSQRKEEARLEIMN